jgi:membrane-bound serine protease (ClpP class)
VGTGSGLEAATRALEVHLGTVVEADTALRPAGKIRVGDNVYEARTAGEFVDQGVRVRITALRGTEFLVEKI